MAIPAAETKGSIADNPDEVSGCFGTRGGNGGGSSGDLLGPAIVTLFLGKLGGNGGGSSESMELDRGAVFVADKKWASSAGILSVVPFLQTKSVG
jgi:hypothetical protein